MTLLCQRLGTSWACLTALSADGEVFQHIGGLMAQGGNRGWEWWRVIGFGAASWQILTALQRRVGIARRRLSSGRGHFQVKGLGWR